MDISLASLDDDESVLWHAASLFTSPSGQVNANDGLSCSDQAGDSSPEQTTNMTTALSGAVPKACLTCRGRHLKCSGLRPCSRCVASNTECVFVASKRGSHGSRRNHLQTRRTQQRQQELRQPASPTPGENPDAADNPALRIQQTNPARPESQSRLGASQPDLTPHSSTCLVNTTRGLGYWGRPASGEASVINNPDTLLTSFYYYAFASHPFVLPRDYLCKVEDRAMDAVEAAMRWVGSLYLSSYATARGDLYNKAQRLARDPQTPRNGFLVQAMMLLVVALDGCCEQRKATKMLADVEQLALQIQLHTRDFATLQGRGIPVLEESWRRTWWDLYVMDGMIAGVRRESNFALYDVAADVLLPCEEDEYLSGVIPTPLPLQALNDSGFLEQDPSLSSFSYRILSGRNLGAMLRLPEACSPTDAAIEKMETLLTSWRLHIPASKQDALHRNGTKDEMMFQACMMMHATSIMLHQPFSRLATQPVQAINACAPPRKSIMPADMALDVHTIKMNESARAISAMVTCGVSLLSHTHFFTCVLTLSSIVHLSHWALLSSTCGDVGDNDHGDESFLREQIRLNMGALQKRATVWPAARQACVQVTSVARNIYQSKKEQQSIHPSIWDTILDDSLFM